MSDYYQPGGFKILPPVVKNLLIINGLFFLATIALDSAFGINLINTLGLHAFESRHFEPYQLVTHLFMHGGFGHILLNMFALWMFGNALENVWGGKRFLIYYLFTGFGAAALHLGVIEYQISSVESALSAEQIQMVTEKGWQYLEQGQNFINSQMAELNLLYNRPTVGASGAVFGVLLAFGMIFPDTLIYIYFLFPIKAKYFVMIFGAIELYSGIANNPGDNVAHFAHLGGMLFGYIMIKYWKSGNS